MVRSEGLLLRVQIPSWLCTVDPFSKIRRYFMHRRRAVGPLIVGKLRIIKDVDPKTTIDMVFQPEFLNNYVSESSGLKAQRLQEVRCTSGQVP